MLGVIHSSRHFYERTKRTFSSYPHPPHKKRSVIFFYKNNDESTILMDRHFSYFLKCTLGRDNDIITCQFAYSNVFNPKFYFLSHFA